MTPFILGVVITADLIVIVAHSVRPCLVATLLYGIASLT